MNIGLLLPHHARYRPDHLAVVFDGARYTYGEFNARVNRSANMLRSLGLVKGDKAATILSNCLEQLEVYWAAAKIGVVVVPLSPLLRGPGLVSLLNDSDSALVISNAAMKPELDKIRGELPNIKPDRYILVDAPAAEGYRNYHDLTAAASENEPPYIPIGRDDPYNIIYSSGTTGLPKGIIHTHGIRAHYCLSFASAWRMTPESVALHAGSVVFNGAFLTLMPAFYLGTPFILMRQFNPEAVIETVQREKVTHMMMVPSQIVPLLHSPNFNADTMKTVQMLGSVGAPLHLEHREELNKRLPGVFYELYGLTEGLATILDKTDYARKPGSVGKPPVFQELRIVDENGRDVPPGTVGEIIGRSPMMMPGYYKRPELTASAVRDGWLHSGDMGYLDEDGFLYLVDRKKDMIISGGVNVYPRDIEEIVVQHPAVREAAVFGVPDERWGETPVAAVILSAPDAISADELRDWVNERVAARYQKLSRVILREDFPRSVAGKTLKRIMRDEYWQQSDVKI